MLNARNVFDNSIENARQQTVVYQYLSKQIMVPFSFDDILRNQIVISVSAFDKLLHDIIKIGMCQIFSGHRAQTAKFLNEKVSLELHMELSNATIPPKEFIFEKAIIEKLKVLTFQHPDKISDGLSFIWLEQQKWEKISAKIGESKHTVTTQMKLISMRRNSIVHESDIDPLTSTKTSINTTECNEITDFIEKCGHSIVDLVI